MSRTAKLRVGVLLGGQSTEHEISILSARNVVAALDRNRFEPVLVGIGKDGRWLMQDERDLLCGPTDPRRVSLQPGLPVPALGPAGSDAASRPTQLDVIFPVLHGTLGEDGAIQGLCEVAGIACVGAGILGSAIGMDKDVMKRLLREADVPIAEFRTLRRDLFDRDPAGALREIETLGFPMFTKPANAGSSVGVRKVASAAQLPAAIRHAFEFDTKVLAEAAVVGREIELAVLDGHPPTVSGAGEIVVEHRDGFYSYDAKYVDEGGARLEIPAGIPAESLARAQTLALRAFEVLECAGMARVDMFLTPAGKLLINEINTIPGFTAISMYPKLMALAGVSPTELVTRLIKLAIERHEREHGLERSAK